MTDEELAYWGMYGRMINSGVEVVQAPSAVGSVTDLWNAFGALEQKVRDLTNP